MSEQDAVERLSLIRERLGFEWYLWVEVDKEKRTHKAAQEDMTFLLEQLEAQRKENERSREALRAITHAGYLVQAKSMAKATLEEQEAEGEQ